MGTAVYEMTLKRRLQLSVEKVTKITKMFPSFLSKVLQTQ
jgi:hypothetical protein